MHKGKRIYNENSPLAESNLGPEYSWLMLGPVLIGMINTTHMQSTWQIGAIGLLMVTQISKIDTL